jgi:hypothetical protein
MGGLSGLSGWSGLSGLTGLSYDWFVDSVNGNDANRGNTAAGAFQTIAALEAAGIAAGDRIALSGTFREQLDITVDNVTVGSYGGGATLDASDVIPAGSWAATGGTANVYEASVSLAVSATLQWVNAWEDDEFLARAANVAACDAAPGSYYPSAETGNITLYVHPYGSTDPTSDGKTYEVSVRQFGLDAGNTTGASVTGIETKRNLYESGSLRVGRSARLIDCTCSDGSKHNLYYKDGTYLQNVTATNAYYGGTNGVMFIYNENTPAGLGISHVDCTAQLTGNTVSLSNGHISGFGGHNNTSGNFGAVAYAGCMVQDLLVGWSVPRHGASLTITNPAAVDVGTVFSFTDANIPATAVSGGALTPGAGNVVGIASALGGNLSMTNVTANCENPGIALLYSDDATLTLTNCTFDDSTSTIGNSRRAVQLGGASSDLIVNGCAFTGGNWRTYIYTTAFNSIRSDNNTFGEDNAGPNSMDVGGVDYAVLSTDWIGANIANVGDLDGTATQQDAHSTILA